MTIPNVTGRVENRPDTEIRQLRTQFNRLVDVVGGDRIVSGNPLFTPKSGNLLVSHSGFEYVIAGKRYYAPANTDVALDDGADDNADIANGKFAMWSFEVDRLGIVTSRLNDTSDPTAYAGEASRLGAMMQGFLTVTSGSLIVGALILEADSNTFIPDTGQIGANSDSDNERFYNFVGTYGVITPWVTGSGTASADFIDSETGSSGNPYDYDYPAAQINLIGQAQAIAAADDAGLTLADTINSGSLAGVYFGAWLVVFDAGNVDTAAPAIYTIPAKGFGAAAQNMLYTSRDEAMKALDGISLPRVLVELGRIVVSTVTATNWLGNDSTEGEFNVTAANANIASAEFFVAAVPSLLSTVNA